MKVLITGVSGFVGAAVARELIHRGATVAGLVRKQHYLKEDDLQIIDADLMSYDSLENKLGNSSFDTIVDAAAMIPIGAMKTDYVENIIMTSNLLRVLKKNPPDYYVKLSTIDVYKIENKISEQSEVCPQSYYSVSKRTSEQYVDLWQKELGVQTCILRLTQIFGPGDRSRKFIPSIIRGIKGESKVNINGDGSERRDFMFIDDVGKIIAEFCEKKVAGVFNIASGKSRSLMEVVRILQKQCDKSFEIEYRERTKAGMDYEFDVANLVAAIGELKLTPFQEALRQTYVLTQI